METRLLAVFTAGLKSVSVERVVCRVGHLPRRRSTSTGGGSKRKGPAGLAERSRRPHRSPGMIAAALEDEIARLRKELPLDNGAQTIAYHLAPGGMAGPVGGDDPPGAGAAGPGRAAAAETAPVVLAALRVAGTERCLADRRHPVGPGRRRRRCGSWISSTTTPGFSSPPGWPTVPAARPPGTPSVTPPAAGVFRPTSCPTTAPVSPAGSSAAPRWSSNETSPPSGIRHITSTPGHPQTCGKIERSHQTTKRWLARQRPARTLAELQAQLDDWLDFYNHQRPHRALDGAVPAERWAASPPDRPGPPIPEPLRAELRLVCGGRISWDGTSIGVGGNTPVGNSSSSAATTRNAIFSERRTLQDLR